MEDPAKKLLYIVFNWIQATNTILAPTEIHRFLLPSMVYKRLSSGPLNRPDIQNIQTQEFLQISESDSITILFMLVY